MISQGKQLIYDDQYIHTFVAEAVGTALMWPTHIDEVAAVLATNNPAFDQKKFKRRAWKAWEDTHLID